jgi:hypothetical protein
MKNLYRFTEFLSEDDNMGDFAKKFTERMSSIGDGLGKEKEEKKKDTPFKDKTEGNAFRKWMKENYPNFKDGKEPLSATGEYNNPTIQQAWKEHGEEYKKSQEKK